jgi:histidinol-phosphate aminotransferase
MYRIVAMTMAATVRAVPARPDLHYDVDSIVAAATNAKLVFLCNPNNPTGLRLSVDEVARLVKSVSCIVAVDEAYAEFSGESVLSLVREQPRLIVIRTLSKAFSLAGARVGYAVTSPETAELANRVRPPNSISYVSVVLGEASVRDRHALRSNIATLVAEREWLSAELARMGLGVIPSSTNFVLVRMPSPESAARMYSACIRVGLVLRYYDTNPVLSTYLRITARSRSENERLLQTMRAALEIAAAPR